jgi:hypothetical protein
MDADNDVIVRDQDHPAAARVPAAQRRGAAVPVRRAAAPVRRGRPPLLANGLPTNVQTAIRTITGSFERVRVLETELGLMRRTNEELQERLIITEGDMYEARSQLSNTTQERDLAQEELQMFKVDTESIQDISLERLAAGQMTTGSVHNMYINEMTRRVADFHARADFGNSKYILPTCPICLDNSNVPNMVLSGCGHTMCQSCSAHMLQPYSCPICRKVSLDLVKVYGISQ